MSTRTQQRPAGLGRFARHAAPPPGRFARHSAPSTSRLARTMPKRTVKVTPAKSHKKAKGFSGMTALAGVAGLAFRNRDKIAGMMGRRRRNEPARPSDV